MSWGILPHDFTTFAPIRAAPKGAYWDSVLGRFDSTEPRLASILMSRALARDNGAHPNVVNVNPSVDHFGVLQDRESSFIALENAARSCVFVFQFSENSPKLGVAESSLRVPVDCFSARATLIFLSRSEREDRHFVLRFFMFSSSDMLQDAWV